MKLQQLTIPLITLCVATIAEMKTAKPQSIEL
jgi:hypothetical protein